MVSSSWKTIKRERKGRYTSVFPGGRDYRSTPKEGLLESSNRRLYLKRKRVMKDEGGTLDPKVTKGF